MAVPKKPVPNGSQILKEVKMSNKQDKGNTNRNYDLFFKTKEMESMSLNQKIDNLLKYYHYDAELVKNQIKSIYGYEEEFINYTMIKNDINSITDMDLNKFEDIILENINRNEVVKSAKKENNKYIIETQKGKMEFTSIVDFLNKKELEKISNNSNDSFNKENLNNKNYQKEKDNNEKEDVDELIHSYIIRLKRKEGRRKRCHGLSIKGSEILKKFYSIDNKVVTGYAYENIDKVRYLHSWIELEEDGEQYVIDSTLNIVMNKEGYYLLMHIKEKEIESVVDAQLIIDDFETYGDFIHYTEDAKTYLTCRDLMIKDLSRNQVLFGKDNNEEER